jgi:hypothetical protein
MEEEELEDSMLRKTFCEVFPEVDPFEHDAFYSALEEDRPTVSLDTFTGKLKTYALHSFICCRRESMILWTPPWYWKRGTHK